MPTPNEPAMNATALTPTFALDRSADWQLLDFVDAAMARMGQSLMRAAEGRVARRASRVQQAHLMRLDSQTLRDIGVGDWVASATQSDDANYRRMLELRGF